MISEKRFVRIIEIERHMIAKEIEFFVKRPNEKDQLAIYSAMLGKIGKPVKSAVVVEIRGKPSELGIRVFDNLVAGVDLPKEVYDKCRAYAEAIDPSTQFPVVITKISDKIHRECEKTVSKPDPMERPADFDEEMRH
jgi:hypothetical protein